MAQKSETQLRETLTPNCFFHGNLTPFPLSLPFCHFLSLPRTPSLFPFPLCVAFVHTLSTKLTSCFFQCSLGANHSSLFYILRTHLSGLFKENFINCILHKSSKTITSVENMLEKGFIEIL